MTLKRHGRCTCGAPADLEISSDGWDAPSPSYQMTTTCKASCPVKRETMAVADVEALGWRYDGQAGTWSQLANTSVEGWVP